MEFLKLEPLTRSAFAPYGDVIDTRDSEYSVINGGYTLRFHDLARVDIAAEGGRPLINIFRCQPRTSSFRLDLLERHPLGSQAFIPLRNFSWFVVVADEYVSRGDFHGLKAFRATGSQGVNYAPGVWHHPLLVEEADSDFLVVDRGGTGKNLEEHTLRKSYALSK